MSLDLSAIEASLKEVDENNKETLPNETHDHQVPPSPILSQADDLLLELNMKQMDPKLEHKYKCKPRKKHEKTKGYFEKQEMKQKQQKKLKKNK